MPLFARSLCQVRQVVSNHLNQSLPLLLITQSALSARITVWLTADPRTWSRRWLCCRRKAVYVSDEVGMPHKLLLNENNSTLVGHLPSVLQDDPFNAFMVPEPLSKLGADSEAESRCCETRGEGVLLIDVPMSTQLIPRLLFLMR